MRNSFPWPPPAVPLPCRGPFPAPPAVAGPRPIRACFLLLALSAVLAGLGLGCRTSPKIPAAPAPASAEASVKPGVNAEYLKPGLNVPQWVERFEKEGREIFEQRARIAAAVGLRPGQAMADIGAGTGLFTPLFSQAVGPQGTVYAVDIARDFLAHIDSRAREAGWSNVRTVLCTERSVELPAASIDVAFICDTYHHFEYPRSTLASLHRALRPGGEILLVDFKRVPGQSSEWVLNHVRAGQEVVTAELEAAGFRKVEELPLLKDNYVLRFRKR